MQNSQIIKISVFNSLVKGVKMTPIFFLVIHLINIDLSGAEIGLLFGLNTIASITTILPSGLGNDRYSSKNLITLGLIFLATQYLILAYTNNFYLLATFFLLGGVGGSIYKTSIESLFYKSTNHESLTRDIGTLHTLSYITMGLGMILTGYLLQFDISFETLFLIIAILYGVFTVAGLHILPKNETTKLEILKYKQDIFRKEVAIFLLMIFLFSLHIGAEITNYGAFLKNYLHLNMLWTGIYMGSAIMIMGLCSTMIAKNWKKVRPRNVLLWGLFLSGLFHILMTIKPPIISFVFRTLHEIGDAAIFFFLFYGVAKLFDIERVGGNNGILIFVSTIGMTVGSLIFGPVGESFGYNIPLIIGGFTTLLALIITLPYIHLIDHK